MGGLDDPVSQRASCKKPLSLHGGLLSQLSIGHEASGGVGLSLGVAWDLGVGPWKVEGGHPPSVVLVSAACHWISRKPLQVGTSIMIMVVSFAQLRTERFDWPIVII